MTSLFEASRFFLKLIRLIYIAGSIYFVIYGCYTTLQSAKEGNLMVKDEVKVLQKHRYPSLTFCYVFKKVECENCQTQEGEKKSSHNRIETNLKGEKTNETTFDW